MILVVLLIMFFKFNLFKSLRNFQIEEFASCVAGRRLKLKSPSKIMFVRFIHIRSKVDENKFKKEMLSGGRYTEATKRF